MLLRFSVENFLSFKEKIEFSMAASKITRLREHTIQIGDKRILKGGFIFGANASGKSNFIKAIDFARNIVVKGLVNTDFNKKHFRICQDNYRKPGVFQFDIVINEIVYSYGFAVSYVTKEIVDEWLYKISSNEQCIFNRETLENEVIVNSDLVLNDKNEKKSFEVYLRDIKNKSMHQTLLLVDIANRSADDSESFKIFKDVLKWFQNTIVVFPNSKYSGLNRIANDTELRPMFKDLLNYFDTGIEDVLNNEEMEFDKALSDVSEEDKAELKVKLSNALVEKTAVMRNGKMMLTLHKDDNGDIIVQKMVLDHGNIADLFDYADESDGTQRLFDLIPLFLQSQNNKVIFIDEIDRSLHSRLTVEYIKLFYQLSESFQAQLIATTHDSSIMDLDLVRQDEIWFVERKEDHSSSFYSLNKFKERYDKKVAKDYLIGRYGAVPVFSSFSFETSANVEGEQDGK